MILILIAVFFVESRLLGPVAIGSTFDGGGQVSFTCRALRELRRFVCARCVPGNETVNEALRRCGIVALSWATYIYIYIYTYVYNVDIYIYILIAFIHESLVYVSLRFTWWFTTGIGIVGNLDIAPSYPNELCNPLKFNSWIPLFLLALDTDTEPGWG